MVRAFVRVRRLIVPLCATGWIVLFVAGWMGEGYSTGRAPVVQPVVLLFFDQSCSYCSTSHAPVVRPVMILFPVFDEFSDEGCRYPEKFSVSCEVPRFWRAHDRSPFPNATDRMVRKVTIIVQANTTGRITSVRPVEYQKERHDWSDHINVTGRITAMRLVG